uniref:EF-hand domain-containing protein n=1 Tax=Chromera velia CCMP2878 TaxID=1169474 RepID=A0A0G4HE48_9ALVE|eukprot:Cvel_6518.t1-p1 / transcript=Cvel_6518.t1 / gene=Cvel_6518 / organism=Chromera_velia_CCMP2878 / gene_product=hypothetical protein / transcript_product=hypothetical protein / location=Cvel_scaffold320:72884-75991(-) / protein_length=367 / sequence_SO=supercontig / SO=protein_coding / is_pseudo=false
MRCSTLGSSLNSSTGAGRDTSTVASDLLVFLRKGNPMTSFEEASLVLSAWDRDGDGVMREDESVSEWVARSSTCSFSSSILIQEAKFRREWKRLISCEPAWRLHHRGAPLEGTKQVVLSILQTSLAAEKEFERRKVELKLSQLDLPSAFRFLDARHEGCLTPEGLALAMGLLAEVEVSEISGAVRRLSGTVPGKAEMTPTRVTPRDFEWAMTQRGHTGKVTRGSPALGEGMSCMKQRASNRAGCASGKCASIHHMDLFHPQSDQTDTELANNSPQVAFAALRQAEEGVPFQARNKASWLQVAMKKRGPTTGASGSQAALRPRPSSAFLSPSRDKLEKLHMRGGMTTPGTGTFSPDRWPFPPEYLPLY